MISLKYPLLVSFLISTTFTISAKDKVKKDKRAKKNDYTYVLQTEPDKICSKPQKALIAHAPKELKIRPVKNIHAQYREGIDVSHYQGDIETIKIAGTVANTADRLYNSMESIKLELEGKKTKVRLSE